MTRDACPLRIEAVTWAPAGRPVLDAVDLAIRPERVTGLLGPNGSGKTSLLHVAAGLRRPDHGRVLVEGRDVFSLRPRERARVMAMVEQDAATHLDLSVRQVVALGRIPHRPVLGGRGADLGGTAAVDRALDTARVGHLVDRGWSRLSGGERQRTQLARALAQEPRLLLLDEPTNHLDLGHQLDFLGRVRAQGLTVVAALHDLELAAAYCDDLVVLVAGRVLAHGPVADVLTPTLIEEAFAVDADLEPHPRRVRTHVRWNDVIPSRLEAVDR